MDSSIASPIPPRIPDLVYHWFYLSGDTDPTPTYLLDPTSLSQNNRQNMPAKNGKNEIWKPFSMIDSVAIEDAHSISTHTDLIPTDGGRYDVDIKGRTKTPVYWTEAETTPVRRCSWFYNSNVDNRWVPYDEELASRLEEEYRAAHETGQWGRKLEISLGPAKGEYITLHSASVMMHFPTAASSTLDDWGQVQPPQVGTMKHGKAFGTTLAKITVSQKRYDIIAPQF